MNISALYYDYREKSGEQNNNINFVAASLLHIIAHYFSNWTSYFMLILCCRNKHTCSFYNDMFRRMFAEWKEWPLQIVVVNKNEYQKQQTVHRHNIIFTDSYKSFLEMRLHTKAKHYNRNEYYLIFLKTSDHVPYGEMQNIFTYCWQHNLINCVIQIQKENGQVLIFTYYPFTEKLCGQAETVLVNEYNGTSLIHKTLFPKKLKNFYGCPLRVSLSHVPPYVYLSVDSNNATYISGGFEGKFLLELSKKLNFSLDLIVPPYEDATNNNSLNGALKMLQDRKADISLGAIRQTSENIMLLTSTKSYYQSNWVILTLTEAYTLTSLEILLFPFTTSTWYLLILLGSFGMCIVGLLKLKLPKYLVKYLDYVILDSLSIVLGMPAIYKPDFNTTRILQVTWIMFSLILRTIYVALLFHLIRSHVIRDMPESVTELVDQNYSLIMDKHTFDGMQGIDTFNTINFVIVNREMPLAYLEKLPVDQARHMAVTISLIRFKYYIQTTRKINVFKVIPENIIHFGLCMFVAKHSFLVGQLNDVLMMTDGFGIMEALVEKHIDEQYIEKTSSEENLGFGMKQLKMIFVLLLIGHLLATIVFILELLYKRGKRIRIIKKFKRCKFIKKV